MKIQKLYMIEGARQAKGLVVVIDVFRAMTVETYMMKNRADRLFPVATVEEALRLRAEAPERTVLCGERGGVIIDGFDYGNSPAQIENVDFSGKIAVHTTSAGTQGLTAAAPRAEEVLAGSLVSARAIARYIRQRSPEEVSLVCMGLAGKRRTQEDDLCGDYLEALLLDRELPELQERIELLRQTDGAKFFDPHQQKVFPRRDFDLCTAVDSCPFLLRMDTSCGRMEMKRVDVI